MDEARRMKAKTEEAGKIIFWFTDDSWYKKLYGQVEVTAPSSYH